MLLPVYGLQAQFINPATPDIIISCNSNGVENTGTSILGDWQVTVVDGDKPSIIFYNHATGLEDCHLLEAVNLGYTVSDPDVVWDYASQDYIYVIYKLSGGGTGFDGIWAERWRMDNSANFIYADITYTDFFWGIPIIAQLFASNTATYPNIDFHLSNLESVAVWEDNGDILAAAELQNVMFGALPQYHVNSFCAGFTLPGTQPDVALGWDNKIVSFTYKQLNGGSNEIVVRQDAYLHIQAGNPTLSCINETMLPPVTFVDVNFPRISAPKYQLGQATSHDCNVAYEISSTAGENFIGSSTYKDYYDQSYYDPACPPHTYTTVNTWSHDIVNSGVAWSNLNADLRLDRNQRPVSVYTRDLIYNSWTWDEPVPTRFGLKEILTTATQPNNYTLAFISYWPALCTTYYYNVVASVNWPDYLVTGEVWNQSANQEIVSSGSDMDHLAFAFYEAATGEIIIKKAATIGVPIIRTKGPIDAALVENVNPELIIKTYPNPSSGEFMVAATQKINNIVITDFLGRLYGKQKIESGKYEIPLNIANSGIFFVHITTETGEHKIEKIIVNR